MKFYSSGSELITIGATHAIIFQDTVTRMLIVNTAEVHHLPNLEILTMWVLEC